jgi:sialic acid synthase SpsE
MLDHPLEIEKGPLQKMGSAVYLRRDMRAGDTVSAADVVLKSPMDGLDGWWYDWLIGKKLVVNVNAEQVLREGYFG